MNDNIVKRLLWLRQHLDNSIGRLTAALTAQPGDPVGAEMSRIVTEVMDYVSGYLNPMTEAAAIYMRTHRKLRRATTDVRIAL